MKKLLKDLIKDWLGEYEKDCQVSNCRAGCRSLQLTRRWWRNRKRYQEAQLRLLTIMLAGGEGTTVLSYGDVAEEVAPGTWIKVPTTDKSWVVPADVDVNIMLKNLDFESWTLYHLRSDALLRPWQYPGDADLEAVCGSMTANGIDLAIVTFYDNDWFDLYIVPEIDVTHS